MHDSALAIFGGTFDPIHFGHLRVAWESAEALSAELRLMPARLPPHRDEPGASAEQRLAMLNIALQSQDRLRADDRELRRAGASYTIDTLIELREEIGDDRSLVLLVGADAFAQFSSWHRWQEIFLLAHVGVLTRPGHGGVFEAELAAEWYARRADDVSAVHDAPFGSIVTIDVTPIELSATTIREMLRDGREPRFLLPDAVLDYIERHGIYRDR
jgi:nicotinate-nucleotide adenylyltransferase